MPTTCGNLQRTWGVSLLFGYPIEATDENWLHDCLCEMVHAVHEALDAGQTVPVWPDVIPLAHRPQLRIRTGLRDRLTGYAAAANSLSQGERQRVLTCLVQQNRIADLLSCACDCENASDLPQALHAPVAQLFDFAYHLVGEMGIGDRHYEAIYAAMTYKVCPFCGCEYFDAPGAPREDRDHYLAKSRYPFAAANLRNLVPMGMKCNERYKLAQDILRDTAGARRVAFDPYVEREVAVELGTSIPFAGLQGETPDWQIVFVPDSPECETWDDIFHVRERMKRDVLDPSFRRWLGEFASWFKVHSGNPAPDKTTLIAALRTYAQTVKMLGLNARDFLRAPVFEMLHQHCAAGNHRLTHLMLDLVSI